MLEEVIEPVTPVFRKVVLDKRRTRGEALIDWGEKGKRREQEASLQYWKAVEAKIPLRIKERLFKTMKFLQQKVDCGRLKEKVAKDRYNYLLRLCVLVDGDLDNVQAVSRALTDPQLKSQLSSFMAAFNYYREVNDIKEKLEVRLDRRLHLPFLTPESTLIASLSVPHKLKWQVYFRLRYETGARPSEPFSMKKLDVNFDSQLVRLGTAKGSGETLERELPISPLCCEQLRILTADKNPEDYVFTKTYVPGKPMEYSDAEKLMRKIRNQLQQAGYNVRGLNLYVYRHAFATHQYHQTKDLALVSRMLGHRSIETTMRYIHLHPDQPRRYDVESAPIQDKEAISQKIAEGWELALQTTDTVYFKRPRWVP
jgi:integrase